MKLFLMGKKTTNKTKQNKKNNHHLKYLEEKLHREPLHWMVSQIPPSLEESYKFYKHLAQKAIDGTFP